MLSQTILYAVEVVYNAWERGILANICAKKLNEGHGSKVSVQVRTWTEFYRFAASDWHLQNQNIFRRNGCSSQNETLGSLNNYNAGS